VEFAALRAAVKNQETETQRTKEFAFAEPGICLGAGRRTEPVTGERKGLAQNRQHRIARVIVSVETEMGTPLRDLRGGAGTSKEQGKRKQSSEKQE